MSHIPNTKFPRGGLGALLALYFLCSSKTPYCRTKRSNSLLGTLGAACALENTVLSTKLFKFTAWDARRRLCARKRCSSSLGAACCDRKRCSSSLGAALGLEFAARACSHRLLRSKMLRGLAWSRLCARKAARARSETPVAFRNAARACSEPPLHSKSHCCSGAPPVRSKKSAQKLSETTVSHRCSDWLGAARELEENDRRSYSKIRSR